MDVSKEVIERFGKDQRFTLEDMHECFLAGGDFRIASKKLTDEKITKSEWSEVNDFEEHITENFINEDEDEPEPFCPDLSGEGNSFGTFQNMKTPW